MTKTETKVFPTPAVMSTVTGVLISDIGGVYEVLNWMTGESVFTHQIPRISREAVPVLLETLPALQQAIAEAEQITPENYEHWRDLWIDRYGPEIAVPKMTSGQHERIDPLSELAQHVHPDRIVVLDVDKEGGGE